ncbi:hypothetical protein [Dongshaea marina]|uniref:hypothetical protein n=1 Tax=Dongshaea marina TaxID=2047966 RepID=UPI000D3EDF41|nr:hypothetical protein [Dongshaea marina]
MMTTRQQLALVLQQLEAEEGVENVSLILAHSLLAIAAGYDDGPITWQIDSDIVSGELVAEVLAEDRTLN